MSFGEPAVRPPPATQALRPIMLGLTGLSALFRPLLQVDKYDVAGCEFRQTSARRQYPGAQPASSEMRNTDKGPAFTTSPVVWLRHTGSSSQ